MFDYSLRVYLRTTANLFKTLDPRLTWDLASQSCTHVLCDCTVALWLGFVMAGAGDETPAFTLRRYRSFDSLFFPRAGYNVSYATLCKPDAFFELNHIRCGHVKMPS